MNVFYNILIFFHVIIGWHFFSPLFLYLLSIFKIKNKSSQSVIVEADYGVILTAYKQTNQIHLAVKSILDSNYNNFVIYVVADACDIIGLEFSDKRVVLLRPEKVLASNIKSHFYAIDRFIKPHERLTIIDSDNLIHGEYFNELNRLFAQGYKSVQGVRAAKNLDSIYACLDEAGDIYYRYIDRKLMFDAGSSAALSGSGMAFETQLYKDCLEGNQVNGAGFDKILQYEILMRGMRIAFAEKAIVYDEKTAKTDQLVNQRSRWINTWFKFFFLGLKLMSKSFLTLNWNRFVFSNMLLRPPLFILLIFSFIIFIIDLIFAPNFSFYWIFAGFIFLSFVWLALRYFKADDRIYKSLFSAPKFICFQIKALIKSKRANEISVATEHFFEDETKS